jgi:hypothetical protein
MLSAANPRSVWAEAKHAAGIRKRWAPNRRQSILRRYLCNSLGIGEEHRVGADDDGLYALRYCGREDGIEIARLARFKM